MVGTPQSAVAVMPCALVVGPSRCRRNTCLEKELHALFPCCADLADAWPILGGVASVKNGKSEYVEVGSDLCCHVRPHSVKVLFMKGFIVTSSWIRTWVFAALCLKFEAVRRQARLKACGVAPAVHASE